METENFFNWIWNTDAGELERMVNDYDRKHNIKCRDARNHTKTEELNY